MTWTGEIVATVRYRSCIGLGIAAAVLLGAGAAKADCYCRTATGDRVALGEVACLKSLKAEGGLREARCVLILNNTAWKFTGNPCPLARQGGRQDDRLAQATPAVR